MAAILALARLACFRDEPSNTHPSHSFSSGVAPAPSRSSIAGSNFASKSCQFAQRWDLIEAAKVAESILRGWQQNPRSEKRQLIEGVLALPGEGACPPLRLALGVGIEAAHHLRGGCRQPVEAQPRRRERGWPGIGCGRQILLKLSELGGSGFSSRRPRES